MRMRRNHKPLRYQTGGRSLGCVRPRVTPPLASCSHPPRLGADPIPGGRTASSPWGPLIRLWIPPGWDTHNPSQGNCFRLSVRRRPRNLRPLYSALYSGQYSNRYIGKYCGKYCGRYSAHHDAPSSTSACLQYVTPSGVSPSLASHHAIRFLVHQ